MGRVDPVVYKQVFEDNPQGAAILEELLGMFAANLWVKGGRSAERETSRRLGNFEVVNFINTKINRAHGIPDPNSDELPAFQQEE